MPATDDTPAPGGLQVDRAAAHHPRPVVPLLDERQRVRAAVVQMSTGEDMEANISAAHALIDEAAERGARLVVLPEKFNYLGRPEGVAAAKQSLEGPLLAGMADLARRHRLYLVAGSIWEDNPAARQAFNTSVLFGPEGARLALYRKMHMFDVEVGGHVYRESDECLPGQEVVAVSLPAAASPGAATVAGPVASPDPAAGAGPAAQAGGGAGEGEVVLGMSVCYDLRFPELYRALLDLGSRIIVLPAAFTLATGKDHWEVLLRARAIENQVFIVAANQFGRHEPGVESYGHSMIVDPWGLVLARAADGPGVAVADLDLARLERIRAYLPALQNRARCGYDERRLLRPYA